MLGVLVFWCFSELFGAFLVLFFVFFGVFWCFSGEFWCFLGVFFWCFLVFFGAFLVLGLSSVLFFDGKHLQDFMRKYLGFPLFLLFMSLFVYLFASMVGSEQSFGSVVYMPWDSIADLFFIISKNNDKLSTVLQHICCSFAAWRCCLSVSHRVFMVLCSKSAFHVHLVGVFDVCFWSIGCKKMI